MSDEKKKYIYERNPDTVKSEEESSMTMKRQR